MDKLEIDNWKFLPEFFYDLICRIVPGAVVLLFYLLDSLEDWSGLFMFSLALLVAYVIGLVLDKLSEWLLQKPMWELLKCSKRRELRRVKSETTAVDPRFLMEEWRVWEWVHKRANSSDKIRGKKLIAEMRAIRNLLFFGLALLACALFGWLVSAFGFDSLSDGIDSILPEVLVEAETWGILLVGVGAIVSLAAAHVRAEIAVRTIAPRNEVCKSPAGNN